ncbi:hypothetical protein [Butyricicoccus porcorum]|uniref:hypothetical protein n=1 Tax=Butyricicoccus porcorum TaxID=1945634 RepID=UPI003F4A897E
MPDIYNLAVRFRRAIDTAVYNRELTMYPFYKFPDDCCDMMCDLLAQYLHENDIPTVQINGEHKNNHQWHHVWLQTMDGIVVDITGDQFNGKTNMPNNIQPVHVGREGSIHGIFCKNRRFEGSTEFVGERCFAPFGVPNRRQKDLIEAYNIILQYL